MNPEESSKFLFGCLFNDVFIVVEYEVPQTSAEQDNTVEEFGLELPVLLDEVGHPLVVLLANVESGGVVVRMVWLQSVFVSYVLLLHELGPVFIFVS